MAQLDLKLTAEAWVNILINIWEETAAKMEIHSTGDLVESFYGFVHTETGGDPDLIDLAFKFYGNFVDWGVGRGVDLEHRKILRETGTTGRRRKPWYTSTFYLQLKRLREIMAKKHGQKAIDTIVNAAKVDQAQS